MALKRSEKEAIVKELHEKFSRSATVIMTKFSGLSVAQATELRNQMRDVGGEFKVSKNTLFKIAAKDTQVEALEDLFVGQNAVVVAYEDPVAVAKALVEFARKNEAITIEGGVLDGKKIDASGIEALSKLPSREVLLGQFLSVLVGPHRGLVQALAGIPRKMLYALQAIADSKE